MAILVACRSNISVLNIAHVDAQSPLLTVPGSARIPLEGEGGRTNRNVVQVEGWLLGWIDDVFEGAGVLEVRMSEKALVWICKGTHEEALRVLVCDAVDAEGHTRVDVVVVDGHFRVVEERNCIQTLDAALVHIGKRTDTVVGRVERQVVVETLRDVSGNDFLRERVAPVGRLEATKGSPNVSRSAVESGSGDSRIASVTQVCRADDELVQELSEADEAAPVVRQVNEQPRNARSLELRDRRLRVGLELVEVALERADEHLHSS